jgi:hypothetical protein
VVGAGWAFLLVPIAQAALRAWTAAADALDTNSPRLTSISNEAPERSAARCADSAPRAQSKGAPGWAILDSNQGPPPYQSGALTD